MKYYYEKHPGQVELVIVTGLQAIKIPLNSEWSFVIEKAMLRSGASEREGNNGYYELTL